MSVLQWLDQVNAYRALANLPIVNKDSDLSKADYNLAEYEVEQLGYVDHLDGQIDNSHYWAAQSSNLFGSPSANTSDTEAIDNWMAGVFHGIRIIDPHLKTVGFGSYRDASKPLPMVAALDILSGLDWNIVPNYPIMWPAGGKTTSLTTYSQGEMPDAQSKCGYTQLGLPIFLQLRPGSVRGNVTSNLILNGTPVTPLCEMDENNYTNSDPDLQGLGRRILQKQGAVVLLPPAPLTNGTYTVAISVNNQSYNWSFTVRTRTIGTAPFTGEIGGKA